MKTIDLNDTNTWPEILVSKVDRWLRSNLEVFVPPGKNPRCETVPYFKTAVMRIDFSETGFTPTHFLVAHPIFVQYDEIAAYAKSSCNRCNGGGYERITPKMGDATIEVICKCASSRWKSRNKNTLLGDYAIRILNAKIHEMTGNQIPD